MTDFKEIIQLKSSEWSGCSWCKEGKLPEALDERVNHYVSKHGFKILHVGQETTWDMNSNAWHMTVAVLGHQKPPKKQPVPRITGFNIVFTDPSGKKKVIKKIKVPKPLT